MLPSSPLAAPCVAFLLAALLTSIFQRKQEAKNPYVRLVEVSEETTDPAPWGMNWPREYDDYKRTAEITPHAVRRLGGAARREGERDPWLTRMFAGYAFAIDYRDRRGQPTCSRIRSRPGA